MAFSIPKISYQSMLKDGSKHYQGLEEAVLRNIDACKQIATITKSSFGPNGMKKMVVNHIDKLFVTKDAATILKELDIEHPAAKILFMASKMAEQEVGDGTNFVIQFSSALMNYAADILRLGISPCDIIDGYKLASKKVLEILPSLVCCEVTNLRDIDTISRPLCAVMATKQILGCDHIAKLVSQACVLAKPVFNKNFNVDNIRSVKILGAGITASEVYQGLVVQNDVEGTIKRVKDAKIVVFNTEYDLMNTDTKGTILMNTAKELLSFSKEEEAAMKSFVSSLKEIGCNVVVCSGKVADQALDFSNREGIMVVRISSKFEIARLCRATNSCSLASLVIPTSSQMGHCDDVYSHEIGDTNVVVFKQEQEESTVATVVLRGSSESVLDDLERSVDDGVNCYKSLTHDSRLLPGAGATEIELAHLLNQMSSTFSGLEQYSIAKFGEALKSVVRTIAENSGLNPNKVLSKLIVDHAAGLKTGVNINDHNELTVDAISAKIFDSYYVKARCIQLAVDAACTLLAIDQILMARPAGGPAPPKQNTNWDAE